MKPFNLLKPAISTLILVKIEESSDLLPAFNIFFTSLFFLAAAKFSSGTKSSGSAILANPSFSFFSPTGFSPSIFCLSFVFCAIRFVSEYNLNFIPLLVFSPFILLSAIFSFISLSFLNVLLSKFFL